MKKLICGILMLGTIAGVYGQKVMSLEAVSYTHLTLPTIA